MMQQKKGYITIFQFCCWERLLNTGKHGVVMPLNFPKLELGCGNPYSRKLSGTAPQIMPKTVCTCCLEHNEVLEAWLAGQCPIHMYIHLIWWYSVGTWLSVGGFSSYESITSFPSYPITSKYIQMKSLKKKKNNGGSQIGTDRQMKCCHLDMGFRLGIMGSNISLRSM